MSLCYKNILKKYRKLNFTEFKRIRDIIFQDAMEEGYNF